MQGCTAGTGALNIVRFALMTLNICRPVLQHTAQQRVLLWLSLESFKTGHCDLLWNSCRRRVDLRGKRSHGYATAGFGLGEARLTVDWHFNKTTITIRISIQKTQNAQHTAVYQWFSDIEELFTLILRTLGIIQGIPLCMDLMWGMLEMLVQHLCTSLCLPELWFFCDPSWALSQQPFWPIDLLEEPVCWLTLLDLYTSVALHSLAAEVQLTLTINLRKKCKVHTAVVSKNNEQYTLLYYTYCHCCRYTSNPVDSLLSLENQVSHMRIIRYAAGKCRQHVPRDGKWSILNARKRQAHICIEVPPHKAFLKFALIAEECEPNKPHASHAQPSAKQLLSNDLKTISATSNNQR